MPEALRRKIWSAPSPRRSWRMVQRNLVVYRHLWMVVFSGFFEPLFYLLGIGVGLGGMIGEADGVPYAAFVAPGLLAASCMNGAISDGFFNVFFKLTRKKTYEGVLATPMGVPDVAFGEMLWALLRGTMYAIAFLVAVLGLGPLTGTSMMSPLQALATLPAAVLVSATFAAIALCMTSFARRIQSFDFVSGLIVLPMFLLSGTFFPVSQFPEPVRWLVALTPLYHGVELLRQLATGRVNSSIGAHIAYLVVVGVISFIVAAHRLEGRLIR
jgi:lipooligosaccharide transport system permease protein